MEARNLQFSYDNREFISGIKMKERGHETCLQFNK